MLGTISLFLIVILVLFGAFSCMREGAFFGCYVLVRNFVAFLVAMTFCEALAGLMQRFITKSGPAYDYFLVIAFGVLYGATTTIARQIKVRTTAPDVPCVSIFDRLIGLGTGALNGMLVSGICLIMISMMPFLAFMPPSIAKFDMASKPIDTGGSLLGFYDKLSDRFGARDFPLTETEGEEGRYREMVKENLAADINGNGMPDFAEQESWEDLNANGQWDLSWGTRYRDCTRMTTLRAARAGMPLIKPVKLDDDESY